MAEGIAGLAGVRRARLSATIQRLEDDRLRARVEQSYKATEQAIEEWHRFVEEVEVATRAARGHRRNETKNPTYALLGS